MKKRLFRTCQRTLALLLSCVMLAGCLELPALASGVNPGSGGANSTELRLWYDKPTSQTSLRGAAGQGVAQGSENDYWQKNTLPIGNGDLGANVYGEIGTERLTLNEKTLWTGGPSESRPNYIGGNLESRGQNGEQLRKVQELFLAGNVSQAVSEAGKLVGEDNGNYGYYAPWGELNIAYSGLTNTSSVTDYERWLSLDDALAGVQFTSGGTTYTREYFISHPDNVLAVKLTATSSMTLTITLPSKQGGTTVAVGNDTLKLCGQLADNQEKYASFLKAVAGNGTVAAGSNGSSLTYTGTEVTLFFSAATDYKAVYPTYRNGETDAELAARVKGIVDAAAAKGYAAVRAGHLTDYHSLYNRMSLDVGQASTEKPTDELIVAYKNGTAGEAEQRLLEVMLFQYGRYLTISASREDSVLPTNLQGVWNNRNNPPWMSDYHTNVNLQMNYWPTYSTNLAECADPLVRFTESLREPGRVTAKIYAGIESTPENPENGFMAHTQTTPYGYTTPGWSFDWGWSPAAIAWLLQNCWEYYEYTGDLDYMRNNIYPMMKEYAKFYDQFLIDTTSGKTADELTGSDTNVVLASVPAYSPETGPRTMGNTYEHSIIWQLYEDTMTAANLLGVDSGLVGDENTPGTWAYNQAHLKGPIEVGASGQIKEWYDEVSLDGSGKALDADGNDMGSEGYGHRHLSHMLGLYPGDLIQTNEEWVEAARVSMNNRNDVNTGWSMTHRMNVWARLRDGNHAYKVLSLMIKNDKFYNNLWDTHAPFQIDGNFGYTAGVAEMLLQSNMGFIDLLPALPDAWANGSFEGMLARGNFEVDAAWTDGALTETAITSNNGGECVVSYPNLSLAVVKDGSGNIIQFDAVSGDKISFRTVKGQSYTITEIPSEKISVVDNAEALRTEADSVTVRWTAKAGESYQVYRQVEDGEILPVGDVVTSGPVVDDAAIEGLGNIQYYISVNGGKPSQPVKVQDLRNMTRVDDQYSLDGSDANGTPIVFGGSWGTYNLNASDYKTTCRFVEAGDVNGQTATLTFLGTGIQARGRGYSTQFTMAIDGGSAQSFTSSNSADRDQVLGEITGLDYGIHTVVLTLTANKIDFDGFNVLGGEPETPDTPDTLEINTVGGVEKLWAAGETVQFTANLDGVTWTAVSNTSHATTCDYPDHKFSWNADTQTLTAGLTDEVITVTATKGGQTASKQITITPATTVTIVEDSLDGSTPNPAITWNGGWSTWAGEPQKHHGGSKTENGNSYSYTFTGTGIAIFVQKNGDSSWSNNSYSVTLDSGAPVTCSGYDASLSTAGVNQQKLIEFLDLENTSHTITVTATGTGRNLDFIEVYAPNPNAPQADLEDLRAAVAEAAAYHEAGYTEESWAPLATALATAGDYLNNTIKATQDQVNAAAAAIRSAIANLAAKPLTAPANLTVMLAEGTAITLKWDAVTGATGYIVTAGGQTFDTAGTVYRVTGLNSGETYSFTVKAKNDAETSAASAPVSGTTLDTVAPDKVTGLVWNGTDTLSWTAASDNVGVASYKVLVNGAARSVDGTSVTLSLTGESSTVQVIAVDAAGNESIPTILVIAPEFTVTVTNGTIDGGKAAFKAGEAVTVNATLPSGYILTGWEATGITLSDADKTAVTLTFSMPAGNVSLTASTEEKNWNVTANLTNLASVIASTVVHGGDLSFTLAATETYYELPDSIQVTVGGRAVTSPYGTPSLAYDKLTGEVLIKGVDGDVVITAANAAQTPTGDRYTAGDPFVLPAHEGESAKVEAEYLERSGSAALVYGPGFGNYHIENFQAGSPIKLYYDAPVAGLYTLTLSYRSSRTPNQPHNFNWSGENVDDHNDTVSPTLVDGQETFDTIEMDFEVTKAGPGVVEFTADALAAGSGNYGGPDVDSITFTLTAVSNTLVESIVLNQDSATLYLDGAEGEDAVELSATVSPADADNQNLRWTSSDPTVAYVNQDGLVGARGNGSAIITVEAMDGSGEKATAEITVKTRITGAVTISGVPQFGQDLVATINQISHQEAKDGLSYQWSRDGVAIDGADDRHYTVTEADIGHEITVTVFAADPYVGNENGTTSAPVTGALAKGPDVITTLNTAALDAVDFTEDENGETVNGKIIGLNSDYVYEYKLVGDGEDAWMPVPANSTEIEVPAPGSYHVRVAATDTATAGDPGRTLTILAAGASGYAINITDTAEGGVVRANVSKAEEGDTVTLAVLPKDGYQLKDGSLKVNGEDVTANGDGAFTFEMPGAEATVTAEFEKKTYIITHSLTHVRCSMEEDEHRVTHGDTPTITLIPEEGYELPQVITITLTETGAPFTYYTYDNDEGVIAFTGGVPDNLDIDGTGIKKTLNVYYAMYGLSSLGGPRSVKYGDPLSLTIQPKTGYELPDETGVQVTMEGAGGAGSVSFTYSKDEAANTATVTIDEGIITGSLTIRVEGVSSLPPLTMVAVTGTAQVGRQLAATVTPANAFPDYQWIRVDGDGNKIPIPGAVNRTYVIKAEDEGYSIQVAATGTVRYSGTVYSAVTEVVENVNVVSVAGVTLPGSLTATAGGSAIQLTAAIEPSNASNRAVRWSSSDPEVAFITSGGAVSGRRPGTAVITVTTVDGGYQAECTVTVVAVALPESVQVAPGGTVTITPEIPDDLPDKTLTWSSDDESVATVDSEGVVTGVAEGTTTITVTTGAGWTATCTVNVTVPDDNSLPTLPSVPTTTTTTTTNPDGTTTTTVTDNVTGTVTATTEKPDGTVEVVETKKDGTVTTTVTDPEGGKVEKVTTPDEDVTITVTNADGEELAKVEIPAEIPALDADKTFIDVREGYFAEEAINNMAALGVVNGKGDRIFDPKSPMKRSELAKVLYELANGKEGYTTDFVDVPATKWYADSVAWAVKAGVVKGVSDTEFEPERTITREELAAMLCRYARMLGMDTTAQTSELDVFSDGATTHAWAASDMAWCVQNGILQGKGNGVLDPRSEATRAEVAVMLQRFVNLIK